MPYLVQDVTVLYDLAGPETDNSDDVQSWLNEKEAEGYRLVGILQDHAQWDENLDPAGTIGSMLIVHKEP